ncbi:MAG: hypothetical protein ACLR8P_08670 [Clostridium fessum]
MGLCLAFIGSINDEILDKEELAVFRADQKICPDVTESGWQKSGMV